MANLLTTRAGHWFYSFLLCVARGLLGKSGTAVAVQNAGSDRMCVSKSGGQGGLCAPAYFGSGVTEVEKRGAVG